MLLTLLKSKLHGAVVTSLNPDYEGSITIDSQLMKAAGIILHEKVLVANAVNGNRFETYAIPADEGSREICLNGPATRLGSVGDRLIIFTFAHMPGEEAQKWHPTVVVLDPENRPVL
ncbi:MAG: aspartate 1-decarboxylase [Lentisphaerales bacterium]|jgi:aspartate 1-decarboxylase|nr:MAG: aspartate 1-decarboxylase [Lentisphaerales bacterium]